MHAHLLIVAATFLATFLAFGMAGAAYAGTAAVVAGLLALFISQRWRPLPWSAIGLGRPASPGRLALQGLAGLVAGWCAAWVAMLVAVQGLGWPPMDASRFADVQGDAAALLGALALSWTTAAFGEEVLFRGFLQSRLQALLEPRRHAGVTAAVLQALLFALGHAYQGATGMLISGAIGLAFGLLMLRFRNVWPLVIAHGLIDSVSMLALYAGAAPG